MDVCGCCARGVMPLQRGSTRICLQGSGGSPRDVCGGAERAAGETHSALGDTGPGVSIGTATQCSGLCLGSCQGLFDSHGLPYLGKVHAEMRCGQTAWGTLKFNTLWGDYTTPLKHLGYSITREPWETCSLPAHPPGTGVPGLASTDFSAPHSETMLSCSERLSLCQLFPLWPEKQPQTTAMPWQPHTALASAGQGPPIRK